MISIVHFIDGAVVVATAEPAIEVGPLIKVGPHSVAFVVGTTDNESIPALLGALESVASDGPDGEMAAIKARDALRETLPDDPAYHQYDVLVVTYPIEAPYPESFKISSVVLEEVAVEDVDGAEEAGDVVSEIEQSLEKLPERQNVFAGPDAIPKFVLGLVDPKRRLSVLTGAGVAAWAVNANSSTLTDYGQSGEFAFAILTRSDVTMLSDGKALKLRQSAVAMDPTIRKRLSGLFDGAEPDS